MRPNWKAVFCFCAVLIGFAFTACSNEASRALRRMPPADPEAAEPPAGITETAESSRFAVPAAKADTVSEDPGKALAEMSVDELKSEYKRREQIRQYEATLKHNKTDPVVQLDQKVKKQTAPSSDSKDFWSQRNSRLKRAKYGDVSKPLDHVDSIFPGREDVGRSSTLKDQSVFF